MSEPNEPTREGVISALHRRCAMLIRLGARVPSRRQAERCFYVAAFSGGLVKIGKAAYVHSRVRGLRREARLRFPRIDVSSEEISLVAVVRGGEGRPLEAGVLRELRRECLQGEWFCGPLTNALVEALRVA